jgi:cobalamin biosynthesis Mg chelatase CobN
MAGHGTGAVGSPGANTYNSFTLRTPPPQGQPGDLPHSPRGVPQLLAVHRPLISHRVLGLCLAIVALALVAGTAAGTAAAKQKSCGEQVIDDWFDNGRVDKIYPLHCYRDAIDNLPPDILVYGNAKEEINRARLYAAQGKPDPGGKGPTTTSTDTTRTGPTSTDTTPTGTGKTDTTPTGTGKTHTTPTDSTLTDTSSVPSDTTSTSTTDTSGPSSVPVPLIVLGGLAVLLLAAGGAGYLRRRMNGGKDGDADGTPPASA